MRTTALSLALVALAAATAVAQIPRTINYQGRVFDGTNLLNGTRTMTLAIYDSPTGGTPLFTESQNVTFKDGIFTVAIGGGPSGGIGANVTFDRQLWLGVTIQNFNGGSEITPRYILRSSPYSFRSAIGDSAVSAFKASTATSAESAKQADMADSAKHVRVPATMIHNGKTETLTILNSGGVGLHVRGAPYAMVSDGVDSVGRYIVVGENAGSKNAPVAGGYYRDNAPVAWGTIGRDGSIISDFGISSVSLQPDSSFIIIFDHELAATQVSGQAAPDVAVTITVGGVPGSIDQLPAYTYWTYRRDPAGGEGFDKKSIIVRIVGITAGQSLPTARPFSIVVFGRP